LVLRSGFRAARGWYDDDAGGRAVGVELAIRAVDPRFRERGAPADVNHLSLTAQRVRGGRQRPREIDLQLQRREALAGAGRRVDRAAERRIEQRRREAAVRHPGAVVEA